MRRGNTRPKLEKMYLIIILIILQLITNIVLDRFGISKKYFSSSGGFLFFMFSCIWVLCSFFFMEFKDSLDDIIPFLGLISSFLDVVLKCLFGVVVILIVQLIYSYFLRRLILKG